MLRNPVFLIRWMVGLVFLTEGIQKFLFPDVLGVGRFARIGIPMPGILAPFVALVEILFGAAIFANFRVRWAAIPLLIDISVAILTTKLPMLSQQSFWATLHESRVDYCMVMGLLFLFVTNPRAGRAY